MDDIPFEDIRQNMKELNTINTLLGGHKISIAGIREITGMFAQNEPLSICEIGCGGGDNLKAVAGWCVKNNIRANYTGIDIKSSCTEYAAQQHPALRAIWIQGDYSKANFGSNRPSIIFSSLFCHHFMEDELITMMQWMKKNCGKGFFINDLQRNPMAYYLIKGITRIFSASYLVKNDAPLSVARGFKRKEWENILAAAGITNYYIQWKWAFRYLIVCKNES